MEKQTKKLSLIHQRKIMDIGEGIIWLVFGACNFVGSSVISLAILILAFLAQIGSAIYLYVKRNNMDTEDEMAIVHDNIAAQSSITLTSLFILLIALISLLVEMISGTKLTVNVYVGVAVVYAMLKIFKGSIFIGLEKGNKLCQRLRQRYMN